MTSIAATWAALGTTARVVVTGNEHALAAARAAVEAELTAIDAACSRFRDDSELSGLNAAAGRPTLVGPLLLDALQTALRAAALTGGAVDPTIGPALVLAGYDQDFARLDPDAPLAPLRATRTAADWRAVTVDLDARTVRLPRGVRLDLGATAKALAADRAAEAAARAVPDTGVLVSLGGDIAVAGPAPDGGWIVRVAEDHRASLDAPGQTITIAGGGLATSSITVRRWGDGRHHLIDPATGLPAVGPWRTVSVAAASCVDANIASTAAIVLGARASEWLSGQGVPARLVDREGAVHVLGSWPREPEAIAAS